MTLLANDPDVHVDHMISDAAGGLLDFEPIVMANDIQIEGTWLEEATTDDEGVTTRPLRVTLFGLEAGVRYHCDLIISGDNDADLGYIYLY